MYSILKFSNGVLKKSVAVITASALAVSGFVIWDNYQFYESVNTQNIRLLENKPDESSKDGFEKLLKINSDVIGWITIPNINVDYPIVQNESNTYYLNRDVYKNYSMAGTIYMDNRCSKDFNDEYSLIYGHNMVEHLMFGDLHMYKNEDFFEENQDAVILTPDKKYDYKVLAVLEANDSTEEMFFPDKTNTKLIADYIEKNAIHYSESLLKKIKENPDSMYIVSLVTCTSGSTGKRLLLLICRDGDVRIQTTTTTTVLTTTPTTTTATESITKRPIVTTSKKTTTSAATTKSTTSSSTTSKYTTTTSSTTTKPITSGSATTSKYTTSSTTTKPITSSSATTSITTEPPVITTASVYYSMESIPGFYFSHDDGMRNGQPIGGFEKDQIQSITKHTIIDGEEVTEELDMTSINFNGQTPCSVYSEHFDELMANHEPALDDLYFDIPVYNSDELLCDVDGKPLAISALIGVKGDTNLDNIVDSRDASETLRFYAVTSTDDNDQKTVRLSSSYLVSGPLDILDSLSAFLSDVTANEWDDANWNVPKKDREYDARDASAILAFYARSSADEGEYANMTTQEIWDSILPNRFGKRDE